MKMHLVVESDYSKTGYDMVCKFINKCSNGLWSERCFWLYCQVNEARLDLRFGSFMFWYKISWFKPRRRHLKSLKLVFGTAVVYYH